MALCNTFNDCRTSLLAVPYESTLNDIVYNRGSKLWPAGQIRPSMPFHRPVKLFDYNEKITHLRKMCLFGGM